MRKIRILIACMCVCFVSCTHADDKNVKASDIIKMIQKGKPVQMAGKVIFGDLNFRLNNLNTDDLFKLINQIESKEIEIKQLEKYK